MYYRGAAAAVLVYDITCTESFDAVKDWVVELQANVEDNIVVAIAGNKCDLTDDRAIDPSTGKTYADSIGALFFETSAKNNSDIEELFLAIARQLIERPPAPKTAADDGSVSTFSPPPTGAKAKGGCC
mmetsp:Transcript_75049/g.176186  ORF Transcript_75049/g.176186 Transcript_75049/m.176186 type:complete len:128 (-) Transcript_75049:1502-1885(-)